jgi:hypothetical protein
MPCVGFEPMILAFKRAKAVHALDHEATVIGFVSFHRLKRKITVLCFFNFFVWGGGGEISLENTQYKTTL